MTVEPRFTHYYHSCKHKQTDCIRWFSDKPIASFQHQCQLECYSIAIHALNFTVLFGSQNLQHNGHMNLKGFKVLKRTDVMLLETFPLIINHRLPHHSMTVNQSKAITLICSVRFIFECIMCIIVYCVHV